MTGISRSPNGNRPSPAAAFAMLQAGDVVGAEHMCREVLRAQPGDLGVRAILGSALHAQERHADAAEVFEFLSQVQPEEPTHWMNLGTARRGAGHHEAALLAYGQAAQLGYTSADFYFNVGLTHMDRRDYEAARAVLKRALELAPDDASIRFEYAKACYESLHMGDAAAAMAGWDHFDDLTPEMAADVGHRLMNLGETQQAAIALRQLTQRTDLDPRASLTLIQIMERTNRLGEAQQRMHALLLDDRSSTLGVDLCVTRAQLAQRESRHEEAVALFREGLAQKVEPHDRHFALFPLARSLDALGRHEESFSALMAAHESQIAFLRMTAPLACARGPLTMQITRFGCDPQDIVRWNDAAAPALHASPIFVVGFPRSGTTLLEQGLDAHPQLQSMDEQPFVQNALDDLVALGALYPERLGELTDAQLDQVRARYWERVARRTTLSAGQRLVDKNPLNILRLPVIRRLFPQAPILLVVRHPCDVILSCFSQHFRAPDFALLCADLPTLAIGYARSFDFWYRQSDLLRPRAMEIRYETFAADFDTEIRKIAQFLELPWHDALLAPAEHARAKGYISTPSYSQVVQPVSQKAVGRWLNYRQQLAPIIPQIRTWLARWNYADR